RALAVAPDEEPHFLVAGVQEAVEPHLPRLELGQVDAHLAVAIRTDAGEAGPADPALEGHLGGDERSQEEEHEEDSVEGLEARHGGFFGSPARRRQGGGGRLVNGRLFWFRGGSATLKLAVAGQGPAFPGRLPTHGTAEERHPRVPGSHPG